MIFRGAYFFLSNFYPSPVTLDGVEYPTAEHAYQAQKTTDPEARERIRTARTPGLAKRYGGIGPPYWGDIKVSVMRKVLHAKFQSGTALAATLLATGDIKLIEDNYWGDTFWGRCNGAGENCLGRLLMEVREGLRGGL